MFVRFKRTILPTVCHAPVLGIHQEGGLEIHEIVSYTVFMLCIDIVVMICRDADMDKTDYFF